MADSRARSPLCLGQLQPSQTLSLVPGTRYLPSPLVVLELLLKGQWHSRKVLREVEARSDDDGIKKALLTPPHSFSMYGTYLPVIRKKGSMEINAAGTQMRRFRV